MKLLISLANSLHKMVAATIVALPLLLLGPVSSAAEPETVEFSQAELDQMLAPIALYPDALLSQVLIAATYPLEVIQADRWVRSNKDLKTEDALKFAENKDWDPSVKALVAFPDILKRMSEDVDWTQSLGDAFLSDEAAVMDSVQRLRKRAYATGNLEKAQHINVERDDDHIIIEPAQERIVYVPVYDTRVVYGNWWWPDYPPVYWHYPSNYTYVSGFYWGSSVFLGPTYFYSSCHWRDRRVVVIDRHRHYDGHARFYTGRSIIRHQGARAWRHDPVHRHGVAYYNNRLRENYGSRRDSYQNDRSYRQQHRNYNHNPRISGNWQRHDDGRDPNNGRGDHKRDNRWDNNGNDNSPRHHDRAEQVQERLNRNSNVDGRPWRGNANARQNNDINVGTHVRNPAQQQVTTDLNHPVSPSVSEGWERNRVFTTQRGQFDGPSAGGAVDVNNNGSRERRRVVTDGADIRPGFSRPAREPATPRAININESQQIAPRQEVSRQEGPRRAEFSPPRGDAEGRAHHQRAERSNPRFTREKSDDPK